MKQWFSHWKSLLFITIALIFVGILLFKCNCTRQESLYLPYKPLFLAEQSSQIDSIVGEMSIEELIGHLFILRTTVRDTSDEQTLINHIQRKEIGGVLLENMKIEDYLKLTEHLKAIAPKPLFYATDQQYLINNQFNDLEPLPETMSYLALPEDSLRRKLREVFTKQVLALDVNLSISPKVDEALPLGKIAENRYQRKNVSISPNIKILDSLRDNRVLSIADRFSAWNLLDLADTNNIQKLLFPYQQLIDRGISGFTIDTSVIKTASSEPFHVDQFIRRNLKYEGLLIADISSNIDLIDEGISAGMDLFIVDDQFRSAFDYIKYQMLQQRIPIEYIREKVRRILMAKAWMHKGKDSSEEPAFAKAKLADAFPDSSIIEHFNSGNWEYVRRKIFENSTILAHNQNKMVPISNIYKRVFHIVEYGNGRPFNAFQRYFANYASQIDTRRIRVSGPITPFTIDEYEDVYVVILDNIELQEADRSEFIPFLSDLARRSDVILVNFGSYDNLRFFGPGLTIIQVGERADMTEGFTAQLLFGSISARGVLPFDENEYYRADQGIPVDNFRLKFATANEVGIDPQRLYNIDAIALSAIEAGAMPGCQILVAKEGKIIYSKALGFHTYNKVKPVKLTDLYDVASITKAAATTLATMKLVDERQINLRSRIKDYLDLIDEATIRNIQLRDLLSHRSGLQSNMPILEYVYHYDTSRSGPYFYREPSEQASVSVAHEMHFNAGYLDSIWQKVQKLELNRSNFKYSDVNFVLMQRIVEQVAKMSLDSFLNEEFYGPMGLQQTLFNPLSKFDTAQIVPTEMDEKWRQQLVWGHVHDETAALMGGVSGNAGLFTNAEELAIIFQMLLNKGTYGGQKFLNPPIVELFTNARHGNHRGLGFDKPYENAPSVSRDVSKSTFGHTGFTGTCVWVDPENELIYIFLSNRIYPSRAKTELITLRVRQRIQQLIYDALNSYEPDTSIPDLDIY